MRVATLVGAFAFVLSAVQAAPAPDAQQQENIARTKPKDGACSARTDGYTVEVFGDRCAKPCDPGAPAGSREFIPGTVRCRVTGTEPMVNGKCTAPRDVVLFGNLCAFPCPTNQERIPNSALCRYPRANNGKCPAGKVLVFGDACATPCPKYFEFDGADVTRCIPSRTLPLRDGACFQGRVQLFGDRCAEPCPSVGTNNPEDNYIPGTAQCKISA